MNGKHTILGVLVPIISFINIYSRASLPDDIICPLCKHGAADFEEII